MSALGRAWRAMADGGLRLWPRAGDIAPPRADGTAERLEAVAIAQLDATLDALAGWDGAQDAAAATSCRYGHTYLRITLARTEAVAQSADVRRTAARRVVRELVADYAQRATPGSGWTRRRSLGDAEMTAEIKWAV